MVYWPSNYCAEESESVCYCTWRACNRNKRIEIRDVHTHAHTHTTKVWQQKFLLKTCRDYEGASMLEAVVDAPTSDNSHADTSNVYISVVMAARADDRRGDSVMRLQNSIDVLTRGFQKHAVCFKHFSESCS
jgi:hypothetical protein